MAITNPTKYVTVRRLERFKAKLQESGMDASGKADKVSDATSGHLAALDSNGNLTDAGTTAAELSRKNMAIPSGWTTNGTMAQLVSDITADTAAVKGMSYLGTVTVSDLPGSMVQAEILIEVMDVSALDGKVILFTITSSNTAPYHWEYTSAWGAAGSWRSFALENHTHSNKADKVSGATNNNLAALNSNGNLKDSGYSPSDFAPANLVPTQASADNQLADKSFVNSSIATATATYRGAFNLVSDLSLTTSATQQQIAAALATAISTADNNDYCYVQVPTADASPTEIARVDRYKHNGTAWALEYTLNNSGFTSAQWAALNSGITSGLVGKLSDLPTNTELQSALSGKYVLPSGGIPKTDLAAAVQTSLGKADSALQSHQDISGKANKVSGSGLNNHVPALDANGDLKDSGLTTTDIVAGTLYPFDISTLTPSSTFRKNTIIGINGVIYRATADTNNMPCTILVQDGAFVTHTVNGKTAFVVTSSTPNTGWELFTDAGIEYWVELINSGITTINSTLATKMNSSMRGAANGVAELDANGKVPSSQLPSYVDDVQEYDSRSNFPATGETGKIYVAKDTNLTYRWTGSDYVEISPSLALGETSSTAYRGDRGKVAYDHSQATHARTDANNSDVAWNSSDKKITKTVNGTTTDVVTANTIVSGATGAAAPFAGKYEVEEVNSGNGYIFAVETGYTGMGGKWYFKGCRPDFNVAPLINMATGEVTVKGLKIGSNDAITLATLIPVGNGAYTVSQLLQAIGSLMSQNIIVQPAASQE